MAEKSKGGYPKGKPRKAVLLPDGRGDIRGQRAGPERMRQKFTGEVRARFLEQLAAGASQRDAAKAVGVPSRTVRSARDRDGEFRKAYNEAFIAGVFPPYQQQRFLMACEMMGSVEYARKLFGLDEASHSGLWSRVCKALPGFSEDALEIAKGGHTAPLSDVEGVECWAPVEWCHDRLHAMLDMYIMEDGHMLKD